MLQSKSDEEIRWMLQQRRIRHGPVVGSTRALYEKKLRGAMAKELRNAPQPDRSFHREEAHFSSAHLRRPRLDDSSERELYSQRGVDYYTEQYRDSPSVPAENSPTWRSPVWLKLLMFVILSGLIYMIWFHMEPDEPVKRLT